MSGNVLEWVQDAWHDSYRDAPGDGSAWESDGKYRVLRGGSFDHNAQDARAAYRRSLDPAGRHRSSGFRLARTLH